MGNDFQKMAQEMQDQIRELAYMMWEAAGRQQGMAMEYWIAAERQVLATFQAAAEAMIPPTKKAAATKAPAPTAKAPAPTAKAPAPTAKAPAPTAKAPAPTAKAPAPAAKAPAPTAKAPAKQVMPAAKAPVTATKSIAKAPTKDVKTETKTKTPPTATKPATKTAEPARAAKAPAGKTGYGVEEIEGIGPAYAKKLGAAGIETNDNLLDKCGSATGRKAVSGETGITAKLLLKWVNMADLMRISGVGGEFAELLEAAGVDTVKELKTRNAENLAAKMTEVNAEKKLTRRVASAAQVATWVEQAKTLEPKVTH